MNIGSKNWELDFQHQICIQKLVYIGELWLETSRYRTTLSHVAPFPTSYLLTPPPPAILHPISPITNQPTPNLTPPLPNKKVHILTPIPIHQHFRQPPNSIPPSLPRQAPSPDSASIGRIQFQPHVAGVVLFGDAVVHGIGVAEVGGDFVGGAEEEQG